MAHVTIKVGENVIESVRTIPPQATPRLLNCQLQQALLLLRRVIWTATLAAVWAKTGCDELPTSSPHICGVSLLGFRLPCSDAQPGELR